MTSHHCHLKLSQASFHRLNLEVSTAVIIYILQQQTSSPACILEKDDGQKSCILHVVTGSSIRDAADFDKKVYTKRHLSIHGDFNAGSFEALFCLFYVDNEWI